VLLEGAPRARDEVAVDLLLREPVHRDADLGEPVDRLDAQAGGRGENVGRLLRAAVGARVDRVETLPAQALGGSPGLRTVARIRLARVQLAQGRYDDALATLDKVVAPSVEARVLELKGDVKLAQGDRAGALEQWQRADASVSADPASAGQLDTELLRLKIDELGAVPEAK
jgi:Flp pilus assembly protein TadD